MKHPVYFGTYSKELFYGEFDSATDVLTITGSIKIESPSYIIKKNNILYGVSETSNFSENSGALFSIIIDNDGKLNLISMVASNGKAPCHLCIQDDYIFTSNYSEGTLCISSYDKDGRINPSSISIAHYGKSINADRQEQAHIHFAAMSPDLQYLAVCDLGLDKVFAYPYYVESGLSSKAQVIDCPPGCGPRHLAFSSDGKSMYVLSEMGNTVLVFQSNNDEINLTQVIPTIPADFTTISHAAAIHISPDKSLIAASNRGHDSIAVFRIKSDGTLEEPYHIMSGATPRDFRFSPDGTRILSANQDSDTVTVHDIVTGEITGRLNLPTPVCILF